MKINHPLTTTEGDRDKINVIFAIGIFVTFAFLRAIEGASKWELKLKCFSSL